MNEHRKQYRLQKWFAVLAIILLLIGWSLSADSAEISLPGHMATISAEQLTAKVSKLNQNYFLVVAELPAAMTPTDYFDSRQWVAQAKDIVQFSPELKSYSLVEQYMMAFCQLNATRLNLACKNPIKEMRTLKNVQRWFVPFAVVRVDDKSAALASVTKKIPLKQQSWRYTPKLDIWNKR